MMETAFRSVTDRRSRTASRYWLLLVFILCVTSAQADPPADIVVTFGANTVTASGITPGASALFFASGRQKNGYDQTLVRYAQTVTDDDHDGSVTFDLGRAVPAMTVWVVVDMTNGHYTLATPKTAVAAEVPPPDAPLRRKIGAVAVVDGFSFDHPTLELLYINPGLGAWTWSAADGRTLINVADGKKVGGTTAAPTAFVAGGTLVAIDWYKMQYSVVKLDGPTLGRAR